MIKLIQPQNGAFVELMTAKQKEFFNMDRSDIVPDSVQWDDLKKSNDGDNSQPLSVRFSWQEYKSVRLSLWEDGKEEKTFNCCGGEFEIQNLLVGTRYFWYVESECDRSEIYSFTTSPLCPRWIALDGTTNVRDCGTWRTSDGRVVRQGLLYRGAELNNHVNITEKGIKTMKDQLKIKTVLDIRGLWEQVSNVYNGRYFNIPVLPYAEYLSDRETNKKIFDILSEPDNYPIYFHCWGGADRTGTIAFLLNAVLNVPLCDLINDYEATSLSIWGIRSRNTPLFDEFLKALDLYEGDTVNEKATSFMLSSGVTQEQIERIKEILLE